MNCQSLKCRGIHAIVFDIGNVLMDFDPPRFLERRVSDPSQQLQLLQAIFQNPAWAEADRGLASDEETLSAFIQTAPELESEIRQLYEDSGETIALFSYAVPWILELRSAGFRVYALSNYSRHLYERTVQKMAFLPHLDGVVFSWQCHSIKPEETIYRRLFQQYQIEPSHALFLDDALPNVQKARELGMYALQFTGFQEILQQLEQGLPL